MTTSDEFPSNVERDRHLAHRFRPLLEQELLELEALLSENAENSAPVALDQQSVGRLARMDAMQVQAMAQDTARRRHLRVLRLEQALARIQAGDFGYCTHCGETIGLGRLCADPTYHECVSCAALGDRGNRR